MTELDSLVFGLDGLDATVVLALAKAATLVFGTLLASLSWRAYRRTDAPALRALATGIGLVTAGVVTGGLVHQFVEISLVVAVSIQSVFTATGLAVLTYSLYADDPTDSGSKVPSDLVGRGG